MSSIIHAIPSSKRAPSLQDADYDHEILLIDHTQSQTPSRSRSHSASDNHRDSLTPPEEESARRHSDDRLRPKLTLREEIERRRYSKPKYQQGRLGDDLKQIETEETSGRASEGAGSTVIEVPSSESCPATGQSSQRPKKTQTDAESAIDILYENQRGLFLCGMSLFSSKALGVVDKPSWTNAAQKPSATNITNAQVPDPSWEWARKEWKINKSEDTDDDGWEYSFMFSKKFSWHGPKWYNSFVRRRAWIRKRVKKNSGYQVQEPHQLNSDYFTIHPSMARSRSPSKAPSVVENRYSASQLAKREMEEVPDREDIRDIGSLMEALKFSRIDREKMEAVENFIENGGENLYYLKEHMHDIMSQFIFQASRRSLLAHLSARFDEEKRHQEEITKAGKEEDAALRKRLENLEAAIKAADEEVKRLEYWSDIKGLAEEGETKGAVDESQGWDRKKWAGIDGSGPKDVISDRDLLEIEESKVAKDKGKGKV
jgi:hypothetical protein